MVVVAEKSRPREQLRSSLDSAFWGNEVSSPNTPTGVSRLLPCEPPPLSQTTASGISRLQQLLIAQRLFDAPVMPSYCGEQGGLVVDRVLMTLGQANRWWTTLTGRMRVQQAWSTSTAPSVDSMGNALQVPAGGSFFKLRDPDNYALNVKSQLNLGPITMNGWMDVGSLEGLGPLVNGRWPERRPGPFGTSARLSASTRVKGHTLRATAAWNEPLLDSASSYSSAPRALAFDLRSPKTASRSLSYRLGVYRVEAAESEVAEAAFYANPSDAASPAPLSPSLTFHPRRRSNMGERGRGMERGVERHSPSASPAPRPADDAPSSSRKLPLRRSTHAQAAVLWETHRYLWRAERKKHRAGTERRAEGDLGISLAKLPTSAASATGTLGSLISQIKGGGKAGQSEGASGGAEKGAAAGQGAGGGTGGQKGPGGAAATYTDAKSISFERPGSGSKGSEGGGRRAETSLFIDRPHVMVAGGVGGLLRVPLEGPLAGDPSSHPAFRALLGSTLRPFASGLISGQIGTFQRFFLDYTHVTARLDLGLTAPSSPHAALRDLTSGGEERPGDYFAARNRAFAIEGRGATHAVSVSMAQQVIGSVRARVDLRFGLDSVPSPHAVNDRGFGWAIGGAIQHVQGLRPTLLDCVYGADIVLPKTGGAAKACAWFSPMRREAMLEVRLLG